MRPIIRFVGGILACALLTAMTPGVAMAQAGGVIDEIVVEGTQRIEPDTVRSYLLLREGDPYDTERVNRSLKSLFATGLFADVALARRDGKLIVKVVENPIINRLAFEGNKRLDDEELEAETQLRPRVIYTRTKVLADVKRILTLYRREGRFAASVVPKVIQLPQNRIDLVFEIDEGDETQVEMIRFVGNHAFDDGDLKEEIRTKESRWYRFLSVDDRYDPDRLTLDRELLRRFYMSEGYADFRVASAVAELTPDRKAFFITFTVEEGERYRVANVAVDIALRDLSEEKIAHAVLIEEGDWYNADLVEETVDELADAIGTLGYAFVDIRPRIERNREEHTLDITFEVSEGPKVFVERIDVQGNVRTVDEVVRREMRLVEGDAFNSSKLARSRQRIQDLGFFKSVEVEQVPGSDPDKTVITVDVEEKSTGTLALGAGYSTDQGPLGDISMRERNLLGRGYDLKIGGTIAARRSQIDFSLTDPYFMDREVAAGIDIFRVREDNQDTSSHDKALTGFMLRSNYPITEELSQGWTYGFKYREITEVDSDASRFIREQEGSDTISELSHTLSYDLRDSRFEPTEGYFIRMNNDLAGLGGSVKYFRNRLDGAYYYSFDDEWVLEVSGGGGYIVGLGEDVEMSDRFFLGGSSLRGFEKYGIGPRDTSTNDALGGEWYYRGTTQLSFPLGLPNELPLKGHVFTDIGSVGKLASSGPEVEDTGSLRAATGAGLSWSSPFGPISIDMGWAWLKESFDEDEMLRVNFGTRF